MTPITGKDRKPTGVLEVSITSRAAGGKRTAEIHDLSYGGEMAKAELANGASNLMKFDTTKSGGWYDLAVRIEGDKVFECRYAGKVESGKWTTSDPAMA